MFERWRRQTKPNCFKSLAAAGKVADYLKLESIVELNYSLLEADAIVGPSHLVDVDSNGTMKLVVPVCFNNSCASGTILLYDYSMGVVCILSATCNRKMNNLSCRLAWRLNVSLALSCLCEHWQNVFSLPWRDDNGKSNWRFPTPAEQSALLSPAWTSAGFGEEAIPSPSLVAGDADLDGKPDLLTILVNADPAKPSALTLIQPHALLEFLLPKASLSLSLSLLSLSLSPTHDRWNDRRVLLLSRKESMNFVLNIDRLKPRDSSQPTGLDASIPGAFSATFYDVSDDVS